MAKKKHFFINDILHKEILVNKPSDLMYAWNYQEQRRVVYTYTDVIRRREPAFRTTEVAKMVNRHRAVIKRAIHTGAIEAPQSSTSVTTKNKERFIYYWSEKDIMGLMDYMATIHFGRPRNDGLIRPYNMPTKREVKAMIHDEEILYVRQGDRFIPSWKAKDF